MMMMKLSVRQTFQRSFQVGLSFQQRQFFQLLSLLDQDLLLFFQLNLLLLMMMMMRLIVRQTFQQLCQLSQPLLSQLGLVL